MIAHRPQRLRRFFKQTCPLRDEAQVKVDRRITRRERCGSLCVGECPAGDETQHIRRKIAGALNSDLNSQARAPRSVAERQECLGAA